MMKTLLQGAGIVAAIAVIIAAVAAIVKPKAKLHAYGIRQRWKAEVVGARSQDMGRIIKTIALYCPHIGDTDMPEDGDGCPPSYCGTCIPGDCRRNQ